MPPAPSPARPKPRKKALQPKGDANEQPSTGPTPKLSAFHPVAKPAGGAADAVDEEAQAASLLAEVLLGTPRGRTYEQKIRATLPTPLPATIQPPSIVLQHSKQEQAVVDPDAALIGRYDYLTPQEMAQQMAAADSGQAAEEAGEASDSAEGVAEEEVEQDSDDEDDWEPECLLARRRIKDAGPNAEWSYLVRWRGRSEEDDAWVPESYLDPAFIQADMEAAATERQAQTATNAAA